MAGKWVTTNLGMPKGPYKIAKRLKIGYLLVKKDRLVFNQKSDCFNSEIEAVNTCIERLKKREDKLLKRKRALLRLKQGQS